VTDEPHNLAQPKTAQPSSRLALIESAYRRALLYLARPVDALPLDIFRVLTGLVVFTYFVQIFFQAADFSGPDGLIDHELSQEIFWFTRMGLFHPGVGLKFFQIIFLFACLSCWGVILGYRVKLFAAVLYLIAVSTYRWNFLVMYVDDSIIHLALLWLLLLPVGRTLVLREWQADRKGAWQRWQNERVPGGAVRCLLWNLALIYLVAGLWKWTSPMWRDGTALYSVFKTPVSLSPNFWGPQHFAALRLLNYGALILEPLLPLTFVLSKGHRVKYVLLLALVAFHAGTLVTLRIPFANLICIAALVIPFGGELMDKLRHKRSDSELPLTSPQLGFSGGLALVFVAVLTLAMISSVTLPQWRTPSRAYSASTFAIQSDADFSPAGNVSPVQMDKFSYEGLGSLQFTFFSVLWLVGVAQQYQLFNWIDERNYSVHYEVFEFQKNKPVRQVDPGTMMLESTRGALLQMYLHGVTWMRIPRERQIELRNSLQLRIAHRYCQQFQPGGDLAVYATVARIAGTNRIEEKRALFMRFNCQTGEPRMSNPTIDP